MADPDRLDRLERPERVDRIAPTRRPDGRPQGFQRWTRLAFLHWPVPVEAVRPLVPAELELDLHDGVLWVGVVPFLMEGVRPWRIWPKSLAFRFLETNLRTYVVHRGEPGVWFFSLEAASWLAVQAARLGWGLPYHHARMAETPEGDATHYTTTRRSGAGLDLTYRVTTERGPSKPGTLEFFLFERYLLFSQHRGRIMRGQVHHAPYPVWDAEVLGCTESLFAAAGLPPVAGPPPLAHFSPGVDVEIFPLK